MADSREPACLGCAERDRDLARRDAQNRRLVDELNDAEENARVYRRLAYRAITANDQEKS